MFSQQIKYYNDFNAIKIPQRYTSNSYDNKCSSNSWPGSKSVCANTKRNTTPVFIKCIF